MKLGAEGDGLEALRMSGMSGRPRTPTVNKQDGGRLVLFRGQSKF